MNAIQLHGAQLVPSELLQIGLDSGVAEVEAEVFTEERKFQLNLNDE